MDRSVKMTSFLRSFLCHGVAGRYARLVAGIADPGMIETEPGSSTPSTPMSSTFRAIWRAITVGFFSTYALVEFGLTIPFIARRARLHARAEWLHRWCSFAARVVGIRVTTRGRMPRSGLLVSNHLSYIDIIVLSSIQPCIFVAKRDIAAWPLFGWLTRAAGAIFVDRERKLTAVSTLDRMRQAIDDGLLVVLFPEGTSSDGSTVLPFKSALLEPGVQLGCPIAAASIDYVLDDGSAADEVCYWRDMTLVPHLLNLFSKREIRATCAFSLPEIRVGDRKEIARELRDEIVAMRSFASETNRQPQAP
jgi:lyso-ornithine lipid O-acyltransferase